MDWELLTLYKAVRLPLLVFVLAYIIFYVYKRGRKDEMESPKFRMLEDDDGDKRS